MPYKEDMHGLTGFIFPHIRRLAASLLALWLWANNSTGHEDHVLIIHLIRNTEQADKGGRRHFVRVANPMRQGYG